MAKSKRIREKEKKRAAALQLKTAEEKNYASLPEDLKNDNTALLKSLLETSATEIIQHQFEEQELEEPSLLVSAARLGKIEFVKEILCAGEKITSRTLKVSFYTQKCTATSTAAFHCHPDILKILLENYLPLQLQSYAEGFFMGIICDVNEMTRDSSPVPASAKQKDEVTAITSSSHLQEIVTNFDIHLSSLLSELISQPNEKRKIAFCNMLDTNLSSREEPTPLYTILGFLGCYEALNNILTLKELKHQHLWINRALIPIICSAMTTPSNENVYATLSQDSLLVNFTSRLKSTPGAIPLLNEALERKRKTVIICLLPTLLDKIKRQEILSKDLNDLVSFIFNTEYFISDFSTDIMQAIIKSGNATYEKLLKKARIQSKTPNNGDDSKLTPTTLASGKQHEDVIMDSINERNEIELKSIHAQISYLVGGADYKAPEPDIKVLAKVLHEQEAKFSDDNNKFRIKTKINNRAADLFIGKDKLNSILLAMNNVSAQQKPIVANDYIKEYIEELKNNLQNQPEKTPSDYEKTIRSTHSRLPKPPGGSSCCPDSKAATTSTFFSAPRYVQVATPSNENSDGQPAAAVSAFNLIDTSQSRCPS